MLYDLGGARGDSKLQKVRPRLRSTIFTILVFGSTATAGSLVIPGAHRDRHVLKEKDKNMNGPARISALAVALAGMVLSMSGAIAWQPAIN